MVGSMFRCDWLLTDTVSKLCWWWGIPPAPFSPVLDKTIGTANAKGPRFHFPFGYLLAELTLYAVIRLKSILFQSQTLQDQSTCSHAIWLDVEWLSKQFKNLFLTTMNLTFWIHNTPALHVIMCPTRSRVLWSILIQLTATIPPHVISAQQNLTLWRHYGNILYLYMDYHWTDTTDHCLFTQ